MTLRLWCAAIAALLFCTPAQAALWILNIHAPVTGTLTVRCTQTFPDCGEGDSPFKGVVTATIGVDEFVGSTTFRDTVSGRFGGRYGGLSGTIDFDGFNLFGRDFFYYEDNFIGSPRMEWRATASTFSVFVDRDSPGPIPEPATWAMMLLGFGGIGVAIRHRRAAKLLAVYTAGQ